MKKTKKVVEKEPKPKAEKVDKTLLNLAKKRRITLDDLLLEDED